MRKEKREETPVEKLEKELSHKRNWDLKKNNHTQTQNTEKTLTHSVLSAHTEKTTTPNFEFPLSS